MAARFLPLHRLVSPSPRAKTPLNLTSPLSSLRATRRLTQVRLHLHTSTRTMAEQASSSYRANGDNGDDGSTEGESNKWKTRPPYRVHDNDPNFKVRYKGSCHCGKVQYQLSREKPLDSKYCHCTTCQKIHGMPPLFLCTTFPTSSQSFTPRAGCVHSCARCHCPIWIRSPANATEHNRSTLPMGRHLPQGRHQLHSRHSRSRLVRKQREDLRAQAPLQSQLRILSHTDHG